jgi:hypothetical protein
MRKPIPKNIREIVWNKFSKRCAYCGCELLTLKDCIPDHITAHYHTQYDSIENLFPSCKPCNTYKGPFDVELFREHLLKMLNYKNEYLFKSKTKMQVAINLGSITHVKWDGIFYFEKVKK